MWIPFFSHLNHTRSQYVAHLHLIAMNMSWKNSKGEIKIEKLKQELQVRPANESRKESEREHLFAALAF